MLRQRPYLNVRGVRDMVVIGSGHLITLERDLIRRHSGNSVRTVGTTTLDARLIADGDAYAEVKPDGEATTVTIRTGDRATPIARISYPGSPAGLRFVEEHVVLWDGAGRVTAIGTERDQVTADFRTVIR